MGDRGNIVVGGVWMYTHWGGGELKDILKKALIKGKSRWDDAPYLARIIFCEMINDDVDGLTGYGLSTKMGDNGYNILVVDVDNQKVIEHEEGNNGLGAIVKEWAFEKFISDGL